MKRRHLAAIGLTFYALAIIATAPATLIDAGLQHASHGKLRLAEAQGTLWSGSGQVEVRDPIGRSGVAKNIAWQIQPESLLRGHLACQINWGRAAKAFPLTLSLSKVELANADVDLPATALGLGVPKLAPLGLTGDMLLHVDSLSIERNKMQGNATLQWRNAGSALVPISPLGNYELSFNGDGATTHALLHTIQGPLQLDGKASWSSGANPDFSVLARVPPHLQQQLAPLLRLIAVERGAGNFEIAIQ